MKSWDHIKDRALMNLGEIQYSWLDVLYVGLREFSSKWFTLPYYDFDGEICSEYVAQLQGIEESTMSPQKLFSVLSSAHSDQESITINM
jgi:hypothetical protein